MSKATDSPENQLVAYLAGFLLGPFVRRGLLLGRWVPLGQCVVAAQVAYETGALLGYRFRDRMPVFAKLFSEPGRETELSTFLTESARAEMSSREGEWTTFFDLRWEEDVAHAMAAMRRACRTELTDTYDFFKIAGERVRPDPTLFGWLQTVTAKGIGLGCGLPQLTEKLWRNSHELPKGEEELRMWELWRAQGLNLPETPPGPESLQEAQARAVSYIVPYISRHWPEMLKELGL